LKAHIRFHGNLIVCDKRTSNSSCTTCTTCRCALTFIERHWQCVHWEDITRCKLSTTKVYMIAMHYRLRRHWSN